MATANRFSALFTSSSTNAFPNIGKELTKSMPCDEQSKETSSTRIKKTPTKIILGHRSYEEDLLLRKSAYYILADKEKLTSSLAKSRKFKSVDSNEECLHKENCRFAHSLEELKISDCLFGRRCRFVKMSSDKLINVDETGKVCRHKHPDENNECFMQRTGLDKYKSINTSRLQNVLVQPPPPFSPSQPPPPAFSPQQCIQEKITQNQLVAQNKIEQHKVVKIETKNETLDTEQILIIRVPTQLASQALEIAIKSGKSNVQIVIVD